MLGPSARWASKYLINQTCEINETALSYESNEPAL